MKIKGLVFFDLDGTLLNNESDIGAAEIAAIQKLKTNGYEPIICSGRSIVEIDHIMEKAGLESIISMNGQHGLFKKKVVFARQMDVAVLKRLKKMVLQRGEELAFYNTEKIRITGHSGTARTCYKRIHTPLPEIDGEMYEHDPVFMALVLSTSGDDEYKAEFPELAFVRNGPYGIDVFSGGSNKAEGIKKLVDKLGLTDIPTYAFGDGPNDMEMFDLVDYPVAMGNAVPELKEKAAYVTETNVNNGIVQGLKYYHLI